MIDEIEALRSELRSSELRIAVLEKTNEGALEMIQDLQNKLAVAEEFIEMCRREVNAVYLRI